MSFPNILRKVVHTLSSKLDAAQTQLANCISSRDSDIKTAKKSARIDERKHYSKLMQSNKNKSEELITRISDLTARTASAELKRKKAERQVNRSTKRSDDVIEYNQLLENRIKALESTVQLQNEQRIELEMQLMEKDEQIQCMEDSSPIKTIGKVHSGGRGASSWPLYVWELILEQLVHGTPPTSVNANILSFVSRFSPNTTIKELPSIWTIRRGRTVLLMVVQTLAAYRLARAKRWGQLHTDGTGRRQIAFQDLVLSVEEDVDGIFE